MEKALNVLKDLCLVINFNSYWQPRVHEAIAELEEAMKPKTCEKCAYFELDYEFNDGFGQCFFDIHCPNSTSGSYHCGSEFYCSLFEPKEK